MYNINSLLFLNLPLGHHKTEWNPYIAQFIYGKKKKFYLILKLLLLKKEKTLRIQEIFAKVFFFSLRRKEKEKDQLFYKEHLKEIRKYWRFLIFCMYFQKLKRIPPIMFLINPD